VTDNAKLNHRKKNGLPSLTTKVLRFICQKWWLTNLHSALMRDRQHQTESPQKERFPFADNKNTSFIFQKWWLTNLHNALMRDTPRQLNPPDPIISAHCAIQIPIQSLKL
jgi:hypothetical protein